MAEETVKRRRPRNMSRPTPSEQIEACCQNALSAEPSSSEAKRWAQEALFHLFGRLSPVVPELQSGPIPQTAEERRARWIEILRFLVGSEMLHDLQELVLALAELSRGIDHPSLQRAPGGRRGGLSSTTELQLMSFAVEAADELKSRCSCTEEYRAELKESETSHATIEGYRKRVMSGPVEVHPRSSYSLAWAAEAPEILLQQIVWALRDVRQKVRTARVVAT